jgi:hypothetical protein
MTLLILASLLLVSGLAELSTAGLSNQFGLDRHAM